MTSKAASRRPAAARLAPEIAYLALDMALEKHRKPLSELDDEIASALLDAADRRFRLERRMLASALGSSAQVPASTLADAEQRIHGRYDSNEELLADLRRNRLDIEGLRAALHHNLRVEALRAQVRRQAPAVNDIDARLYYQAHRNDFDLPETRSARHILITVNPDFPENTEQAAKRRLGALRAQIERAPDRFEALAQRHSECPTGLEGGRLGRLRRGMLYPALDRCLFTLGEGELSGVERSPLGWHLLRCDQVHPPRTIGELQALPRIRALLAQRLQDAHEQAWIDSLQTDDVD
ncbi:nitrogen fixation protein NifM [Acidihalobacter prosperus]|uniref:peptidylprolyl isomerase n=1 Tax=Acidihalobacter prosperus TaxID=160660 RepID=A0A1A6C7S3_9GAMM|nr:nitrogen fixation protein NifM [Acidihalobacter prosperus]OBS10599.1 nitrogen fixation protein NifM [Acidihalobacter prosperus]